MHGFQTTFFIVITVAICTFITRLFPFILFAGKKEVPEYVKYLGKFLPPAVIAILVIYCFKSIDLFTYPHGLPELIAVAGVVIIHRWKRNNLLSIGAGTILYMVLIQKVFVG